MSSSLTMREVFTAIRTVFRRQQEGIPTVVAFTGQGSQRAGAGKDLLSAFPYVRRIYEEADETVKRPLSKMIWEGQQAELKQTENAQLAIVTHSMVIWNILKEEIGFPSARWVSSVMMGHSVGEYSALCAADCLSFPDALRLVKARGQAMREATEKAASRTVMAALEPCSPTLARLLCKEAAEETGGVCALACDNSEWQQVISGEERAVHRAMELAKTAVFAETGDLPPGGRRCRAVLLEVSGAFHSPCMQPAQDAMRKHIEAVPLRPPTVAIFSNFTGRPTIDPERIRENLLAQITGTVLWRQSVRRCLPDVAYWIEIGPAAVLTPMLKRHFLQGDDSVETVTLTGLAEVQQRIKRDDRVMRDA